MFAAGGRVASRTGVAVSVTVSVTWRRGEWACRADDTVQYDGEVAAPCVSRRVILALGDP